MSTTIEIKHINKSKNKFLFVSTTLREKTYKEITNRKIEKSIKNLNKFQRKMHKIFANNKKHNK